MQYFVYSDTRLFGICYNEHPGPVFPEYVKPHTTRSRECKRVFFKSQIPVPWQASAQRHFDASERGNGRKGRQLSHEAGGGEDSNIGAKPRGVPAPPGLTGDRDRSVLERGHAGGREDPPHAPEKGRAGLPRGGHPAHGSPGGERGLLCPGGARGRHLLQP